MRCGLKCEVRLGKDHRHFRSRMDANVQNMFEINYSQLMQYEILEKLVTLIHSALFLCTLNQMVVTGNICRVKQKPQCYLPVSSNNQRIGCTMYVFSRP